MSETREPAITAPWPALVLIIILVGGFELQQQFAPADAIATWSFHPADLWMGKPYTMLTSMFLHGSWAHVLVNAGFALVFGTGVSRRLGEDAKGTAAFFGFYLVCGLLAALGYTAVNLHSPNPVLGASGAVAGLMGAGSRLLGRGDEQRGGRLAPFRSTTVIGMALFWAAYNALNILTGSDTVQGGWPLHIFGYAAGLFLLAPLLSLIGRGPPADPDSGSNRSITV